MSSTTIYIILGVFVFFSTDFNDLLLCYETVAKSFNIEERESKTYPICEIFLEVLLIYLFKLIALRFVIISKDSIYTLLIMSCLIECCCVELLNPIIIFELKHFCIGINE